MPKPDCSTAPGGQRRSWPAPHQQRGHQKQSDKTSSSGLCSIAQCWTLMITTTSTASCIIIGNKKKKKSCEMSCAENNNCFLTFLRDFVMLRGFYTSSFLRSVDTVRADWNLMLLLTSASPAVIVPLFIITAAEDEKGWVAQTPCLPSLNRAQHTALICSDTAAQILLLLLLD